MTDDEFDRRVAEWFAHRPEGVGIAEWLGMTYQEYVDRTLSRLERR